MGGASESLDIPDLMFLFGRFVLVSRLFSPTLSAGARLKSVLVALTKINRWRSYSSPGSR